jgi:hypothetical protein
MMIKIYGAGSPAGEPAFVPACLFNRERLP